MLHCRSEEQIYSTWEIIFAFFPSFQKERNILVFTECVQQAILYDSHVNPLYT